MNYSKLSTNSLKDCHNTIYKCLKNDDATPKGQIKPYGIREFSDWAEHLYKIENELKQRGENFTAINITSSTNTSKPKPIEAILYEKIKVCLAYEDKLKLGSVKPYGVRDFKDWKKQAELFEKKLDDMKHIYSKIIW